MFKRLCVFIVIVLFILMMAACKSGIPAQYLPAQSPVSGGQPPAGNQPADQNVTVVTQIVVVTATPEPTAIPSDPVGIWEGLSSLNSYRQTFRIVTNGPTNLDISENTIMVEVGSDGNSCHTYIQQFASSADDPQGDTDIQDQYRVGNITCDIGEDASEVSDNDPLAQEMIDAWFKMVDILPVINNPIYIGEEMLNGVMTNHFSFKIEGLGVDSGAEVVASDGEYWLAQDGQYLVKYWAVMETRNGPAGDPNTQTYRLEFSIETQDINQEIVITLPASCQ